MTTYYDFDTPVTEDIHLKADYEPAYGVVYYKETAESEEIKSVIIQNQTEFNRLSFRGTGETAEINGVTLSNDADNVIVGIDIGRDVTSLPYYFMAYCSKFDWPVVFPEGIVQIAGGTMRNLASFNSPITFPEGLEEIGDNFMLNCTAFNQPLVFPASVTRVGSGFLRMNLGTTPAFNSPITFPTNPECTVGALFCYGCRNFNQPVYLPKIKSYGRGLLSGEDNRNTVMNQSITFDENMTELPSYFPSYWTNYTQPIVFPEGVTAIPDGFLESCTNYNQPLDLSGITTIGNNFLKSCTNYNQPLDLSGITAIPNSFLESCTNYNQPLDLSGITTIGTNFLSGCKEYNQPLELPDLEMTNIPNGFLSNCNAFNQPFTFPEGITTIGHNFFTSHYAYNYVIDVPEGVTSIGNNFLSQNGMYSSYPNFGVNLPSTLKSIGDAFLNYIYSSRKPVVNGLPEGLETIGRQFMSSGYINEDITLPSTLTSIGRGFLSMVHYMVSTVYVGDLDPSIVEEDYNTQGGISFGAHVQTYPSYTTGIGIKGNKAEDWVEAFPDKAEIAGGGNGGYRHLRVVTESGGGTN